MNAKVVLVQWVRVVAVFLCVESVLLTICDLPAFSVGEFSGTLRQQQQEQQQICKTNAAAESAIAQSVHQQYEMLEFAAENLAQGSHFCGYHKCLFPLKDDGRIAYLASRDARYGKDHAPMFDNSFNAYNISKTIIKDKYGMDHIYLSPPRRMDASEELRRWMRSNMTIPFAGQKKMPKFQHPKLVIQAVEVVPPEEAVLVGIAKIRMRHAIKGLDQLFTTDTVVDIAAVEERVSCDFLTLRRMLLEDLPCLCTDFQIFLTKKGRLVHLDVDRCFPGHYDDLDRQRRVAAKHCLPQLQKFEQLVMEKLYSLI